MNEKKTAVIVGLTATVFILNFIFMFIATLLICAIVDGLVLAILWRWFVVPVFGMPTLGVAAAIGLALFARFLVWDRMKDRDVVEKKSGWWFFGVTIVRPALVLAMGYIVHLFV